MSLDNLYEQYSNNKKTIENLIQENNNIMNQIKILTKLSNTTETLIFSNIMEPKNTSCPISLEQFTSASNVTMIKNCKHLFNPQSLTQLLTSISTSNICPICTYDNTKEIIDGYTYFS